MHFRLPPDSPWSALGCVPTTLLMPLAARAQGGRWFPWLDPHDRYAADTLQRSGAVTEGMAEDLCTVLHLLWRTRVIQQWGRAFFAAQPGSWGVNLGAGLSQHFQWLDNGQNHWIDADLPEVLALRQISVWPEGPRQHCRTLDLSQAGWWQRLWRADPALPPGQPAPEPAQRRPAAFGQETGGRAPHTPVLTLLEGVLMYFQPEQVEAILDEWEQQAPVGSELIFDYLSPAGLACMPWNPTLAASGAQFHWGLDRVERLLRRHPGLALCEQREVAEAYGPMMGMLACWTQGWRGGPLYGMVRLQRR